MLVLGQITSLQVGSAVAKGAYDHVGPTALAGMRLTFSAMIMILLVRPRPRRIAVHQWRVAISLGLVLAAMNVAYFQAISHLQIGVASTLELLGPLTLSIVLSHRLEHLAAALLALAGVLLLTASAPSLSLLGILLGVLAALCRAGYTVLNQRVGHLFPDWSGLTVALAVGACILAPVTAATDTNTVAAHPSVLVTGLGVALLSSLIPYALDMTVLRRIDTRAFGVLLALSPAVGAGVGFAVLHEHLTVRQICAIALVIAASAWSVSLDRPPRSGSSPSGTSQDTPNIDHR
ncbi:EamA family transporter [Candidatus Protofrankia datiscae]|uniref:EamA family transporter n=1 Tax=Candidatus Protofrankia datiscae TaxID=2716812 RepID=UPI0002EBF000|nr:EamA family transporter [Candidatus Protofrankia datiscae]